MKIEVENITNRITEVLGSFSQVDAITLGELVNPDVLDPYFFLSYDVYYTKDLPDLENRKNLFPEASIHETTKGNRKDRFLIENVPVRIEYKDSVDINAVLQKMDSDVNLFKQDGTYMLYRIERSEIILNRNHWIDKTREKLRKIPDFFWSELVATYVRRMEHTLNDLSAAVIQQDNYFYMISSAAFIKSFTWLLFTINHQFIPSDRLVKGHVENLKKLPSNFKGRYYSFLRQSEEFNPARKREVAELLARSIIRMIG